MFGRLGKIIGNLECFFNLVILLGFWVFDINLRGLKRGIFERKRLIFFLVSLSLFILLLLFIGFLLEGLFVLSFIEFLIELLLLIIVLDWRFLFLIFLLLILLLIFLIFIVVIFLLVLFFILDLLFILEILILRKMFWFFEEDLIIRGEFVEVFNGGEEKLLISGLDVWDWEEKILILGLDLIGVVVFDKILGVLEMLEVLVEG